jgi:hypothetical protein
LSDVSSPRRCACRWVGTASKQRPQSVLSSARGELHYLCRERQVASNTEHVAEDRACC